jgi:hypothetical protein
MFLDPYCSQTNGLVAVSARQASHFAKGLAGDFNPIHDEEARKFCVPGDLLFALVLARYGVFSTMDFRFLGTVGDGVGLIFPPEPAPAFDVVNDRGKPLLAVRLAGASSQDPVFAETLTREYVAFSGQNFPHILVPLMADKGVMINPARPLVMYESMALSFDTLAIGEVRLTLSDTSLTVDGKRGDVRLYFDIHSGDQVVGSGMKRLALGGLQPYDEGAMAEVIARYEASKAAYRRW